MIVLNGAGKSFSALSPHLSLFFVYCIIQVQFAMQKKYCMFGQFILIKTSALNMRTTVCASELSWLNPTVSSSPCFPLKWSLFSSWGATLANMTNEIKNKNPLIELQLHKNHMQQGLSSHQFVIYLFNTDVHLTPFLMLVSHRRDIFRRSKSLTSPLS